VLTLTGYLLVLFAFRLSKTGYGLGEHASWRRLAGAGLVFAGVACVALAR
jgi:drug/metabolite transporter (DMT)-like permease